MIKPLNLYRVVMLAGIVTLTCFCAVFIGTQGSGPSSKVKVSSKSSSTAVRNAKAQYVVIMTYQRCGSTFFGRLFNMNPNSFYQFEPLDGLYASLYGTAIGWNVPSDIYTYTNGTPRALPRDELSAVSTFLSNMFACDFDNLPTEYLAHKFWKTWMRETAGGASYGRCLRSKRLIFINTPKQITKFCGRRIGEKSPERMSLCFKLMNDVEFRSTFANQRVARQFKSFHRMLRDDFRIPIQNKCLPKIQTVCNSRLLRVAKTVRATMDSMEILLQRLPNVKVIHLVRDPRPVVLSRLELDPSVHSKFSLTSGDRSRTLIREASVFCRRVMDDVIIRRKLEETFPGRLFSVTYEQMLDNPQLWATNVYKFVGTTDAGAKEALRRFLRMASAKSSKSRTSKWLRGQLTEKEFDGINKQCSDMFESYPQYKNAVPTTFRS